MSSNTSYGTYALNDNTGIQNAGFGESTIQKGSGDHNTGIGAFA